MRYPCGVGHMGAVRVYWHEGSSVDIYICISCDFCRYTNKRTRKLRRVEIDYIIGRVRIYATEYSRILSYNYVGKILARTYRSYMHALYLPYYYVLTVC